MKSTIYDLPRFVSDLEALHDRCPAMPVKVEETSRLCAKLLTDTSWLAPEFRHPLPDRYARYLLHRDRKNRFVVLSLVWLPGQGTPIHDHECWGVMGMVLGQLEVVNYSRLDDGSRRDHAELKETSTVVVDHMETGYVLPPYEEIHSIRNVSRAPAISLHVYGRDLDELSVFDPITHKVSRMRIKYYNVDPGAADYVI